MENNDQNLNNQVNTNNSNVNQQAPNNTNKVVFVLMTLIIVGLVGYIVYTKFIRKDDKPEPKPNNTQEQENNNSNNQNENSGTNENAKYTAYDFDEVVTNMKKNLHFEYEITSDVLPRELDIIPMDEKYHIVLSTDGKITIKKGENNSVYLNISDVKNIDYCNDMYVRLYILLNNGDVYEYTLEDFDNGKYTATKINEIKNATKFVKLDWADCDECGGNINLGIIDNNNKYIELDSYST